VYVNMPDATCPGMPSSGIALGPSRWSADSPVRTRSSLAAAMVSTVKGPRTAPPGTVTVYVSALCDAGSPAVGSKPAPEPSSAQNRQRIELSTFWLPAGGVTAVRYAYFEIVTQPPEALSAIAGPLWVCAGGALGCDGLTSTLSFSSSWIDVPRRWISGAMPS
jgi:hypothetical protein